MKKIIPLVKSKDMKKALSKKPRKKLRQVLAQIRKSLGRPAPLNKQPNRKKQ